MNSSIPERRPTPPEVERPPIKVEGGSDSRALTSDQVEQIKELTLRKVFLSVLLISIPILICKLDSIILAIKA